MNYGINSSALKQIKEKASWFLALGIGLVILGTLAILYSFMSTIFSVEYLGFLFIVLGIFEGVQSFKLNLWGSFFLHLFLSVLYIASGIFIVTYPVLNAITLTLFLAIFFFISGIAKIIFAFTKKVPHKGWLVFNGALTIVLGILIWLEWPMSGLWVIGVLTGVNILFTGWTLIMLASMAKRI